MPDLKQLPTIAKAQRSPLVEQLLVQLEYLLEENRTQAEIIQQMRDEIAVLKGQKAKPKFKPSGMETETEPDGDADGSDADDKDDGREGKRAGSSKRSKTRQLTIHETLKIPPRVPIPEHARFKGYRDFVVQDLRIQPHNTRYRLEVWQTLDGYALYQHHHCHVTQPLLHEQLCEWGIDISVGQINALLSGANADFFAEKDQLLVTSLEVSRHITVDDSGARHRGHNGYVTQIGNDWFAWFESTGSKSRINFLQLLHAGSISYCLNAHALTYLHEEGLPKEPLRRLQAHTQTTISEVAIISDGAGQFAILLHGLCWVHAERLVHKLIPLNEQHRQDQERVRGEIWDLYADLKAYRCHPDPALAPTLAARFDAIFTQRTSFTTLNQTLKRLHAHKEELLLVLKRPDIVLQLSRRLRQPEEDLPQARRLLLGLPGRPHRTPWGDRALARHHP